MNNFKEIAGQTITDILEKAAFIFTDTLDANQKPSLRTWEAEGVSLRFSGNTSGTVYMWVSNGFACFVAANMLGIEKENEKAKEKGIDALKELLNMIVGNLLTAIFGEEPVFELGLPTSMDHSELEKNENNPDSVWLQAEGNPIFFIMKIDG
jgi:CheY-specific phosphatase CheX